MPELPEVEVVRRGLERGVVGREVRAVEATGARSIRRHPSAAAFRAPLVGRTVRAVDRRGKYLLLRLDDDAVLVAHLRMSGQLRLAPDPAVERLRHTHVVLTFTDGGELRFVDPRTFGELFVSATRARDGGIGELARLGPEPLDPATTPEVLERRLTPRRTRLKTALLDQRIIAGLGNIYSDEIAFRAGLRHDHRTDALTPSEVDGLHAAMVDVLTTAVHAGGSSLADGQYVDVDGAPGTYQHEHAVFARAGADCPRCGRTIERVRFAGRSTHFCPGCQR
ncbi:MAG: bifunctional DNA-formamidopyrimidine glycosylase/DNA-(apurinic or apyrimidinic site) lyase [Actinomycetes bacterium]